MLGCISDRENVRSNHRMRAVSCSSVTNRMAFAGGERRVCCLSGYDTLFQMDRRNLHLLLIADFVSAACQAKIDKYFKANLMNRMLGYITLRRHAQRCRIWKPVYPNNAKCSPGLGRLEVGSCSYLNDRATVRCTGTRGLSMAV